MITYCIGDATAPIQRPAAILHVCNNVGAWGAGFVLAISKKWKLPEQRYRARPSYSLGSIDIISVENNIYVVNMIAQNNLGSNCNHIPLDYYALEKCLYHIHNSSLATTSFHMPRIGCGLAGGSWTKVEKIINNVCLSRDVYVYDLPK